MMCSGCRVFAARRRDGMTRCIRCTGATENAGVENAIRAKLHGWKMQEWKKQE